MATFPDMPDGDYKVLNVNAPLIWICALLWFCGLVNGGYIPPGPRYRCPKDYLLLHPCSCDIETDQGVYVSCNNTNLASMSVALNNLATFLLPVEKLTIHRCHIARLFGSLLYKLHLRVLQIEHTPIETIDEHTFLGVNNSLNELHLINSSLNKFPASALKVPFQLSESNRIFVALHVASTINEQHGNMAVKKLAAPNGHRRPFGYYYRLEQILGNLTVLNIDGHRLVELPKDVFADSELAGRLLRLYLPNGNLSTPPIESFQPLRKLKTLDLHRNQVGELKRNQFRGLRDVEVVDLSFNSITKVDSSHLADLTKLSFFNISHNSIGELTRGAFARNTVLKLLNMSFNKIRRLDSNTFRGMRFLRRLYLSDNAISDVGRGTFNSLAKIGTIDLARNLIKKIDYQMFFELKFIEEINLSENSISEIQKLAFKDIYLTNIDLSKNNISKIESGAFQNCANITKLDLSHNQLKIIPKRAWDETTYATELQLSHNFLTEMNQVPLNNMTGLKILNVSHNEIMKIPKGTFPKLYELHTIDLCHNNLTDIFNSVFQVLFSLRTLNLSHNHLESIKPSTFGALPTLLELDLSHNRLDDVASSSLTRLASTRKLILKGNRLDKLFLLPISVSHLDLSHNEFDELPPQLWPSMNSLLSLDLSHNNFGDRLVHGSFANLLTLQMLNLNYNGIENPPWAAISELTSLQYLYMEGNNMVKLNKAAFGRLPVVFELNLSKNKLTTITAKAFEGLLQLLALNLSSNNISHIPNGGFHGLVALQSLDLSHNKIEKLDNKTHGLFDDCLSLERLNLSHNRISFITRKTFPSDPYYPYKLREIDLSNNVMPVITYDLVFGTSKVQKLNLSHNAIVDIRRYVIGNLSSLVSLDLSSNKLNDLVSESEAFRLPNGTKEIYLSNNQLYDLPWQYLQNISHLSRLDVRNNLFKSFNPNLTDLALKNIDVLFEGNPLNCDCFLLPLKRYFANNLQLKDIYKSIKCASPPHLAGAALIDMAEDRFNCPANVNTSQRMGRNPADYAPTPDFSFRELSVKRRRVQIKWRVVRNDDIADSYVVIRDVGGVHNIIVHHANLPYFKRSFEFDIGGNMTRRLANATAYQICLLARDSKASVRGYYREQCRDFNISSNAIIPHRHNVINLTTFIILSIIFNLYCLT